MNKYLIIIGAAPNVENEIVSARNMLIFLEKNFDYMCIGLDAVDKIHDNIKYVATYHAIDIPYIKEKRHNLKLNTDYKLICNEQPESNVVDLVIPKAINKIEKSGSSSLLGVYAAQIYGYNKIILCGCPLEGISNSVKTPYAQYQSGWVQSIKLEREKVRSMSGWTKSFLGEVTLDWLEKEWE